MRARATQAHARLGYASFVEYIGRLFGYSPRFTLERLRVAEALEHLPRMAKALKQGSSSWSTLRELTRVAVSETEAQWLDTARGKTVREVERLVSGHHPGDHPDDARDPKVVRHVIRLEVAAETLATFREAMKQLRRKAGSPLDDDAALLLMARAALGGPKDAGHLAYQINLSVCKRCARGEQEARSQAVPIDSAVVEMARCDAKRVTLEPDSPSNTEVRAPEAERPPEADSERLASKAHASHAPTSAHVGSSSGASAHVGSSSGAAAHVGSSSGATAHVGSSSGATAHVGQRERATQSIPPRIRRFVLRRQQGCCAVPGCQHGTFLDLHHLDPRAEGGGHDPNGLVAVCSAHHRALHRGELVAIGTHTTELCFVHGDGTPYGEPPRAHATDIMGQAYRALCGLGFRESAVRRALDRVFGEPEPAVTPEQVIRRAILRLTPA